MSSDERVLTVGELAAPAGGRVVAGAGVRVARVASLEAAGEGALCFVEAEKFLEQARDCRASCLIVPEGAGGRARELAPQIPAVVEAARPKLAFALAARLLHPPQKLPEHVHPTAAVAEGARLAEGVYVGAGAVVGDGACVGAGTQIHSNCVVGRGVTVGSGCVLRPNVVLYEGVSLGDRVVLHAGVVVGADGFGYVRDERGVYHKFPQVGTVVIEDDVEIGAGSCVDRGALGETRIGRGTKIDNLVQVGHNVRIGERVVIAAQTGISGSTVIESDAIIGGQVGFGDHARVERGAIIGSKAGVLPGKIVRAGTVQWGVPVRPLDEYKRLNAHFGRLPQMRADLDELKRRVGELTARLGDGGAAGEEGEADGSADD